ncbi:MAG TPA: hypothetical protein VN522_03060 [Solirubrobacterales bacterium]|nr:hypothetical protein [Solirubrobacterales bacterium]
MSVSEAADKSETTDLADIAKSNPEVDVDQVREVGRLLSNLEEAGVERRQYEIASPHERLPMRDQLRNAEPAC